MPKGDLLLGNPAMTCTGKDVLPLDLQRIGSPRDRPSAFRLLETAGPAARAIETRDSGVWQFAPQMKSEFLYGQSFGARRGPRADGSLRQYFDVPAPAIRKCPRLELPALLDAPIQIGHPAAAHADAPMGFPATSLRS